jgi:hypothetical protein
MGMGKAFIAVSDDINAMTMNPAGLGAQKGWELTGMATRLMGRVDYKMAGGIYPTDFGTFGVGYLSASTPAGFLTTDKSSLSEPTALTYGTSLIMLSYGRDLSEVVKGGALGSLSFGANLKSVSAKFEGMDASASGAGLDIGLLFRPNSRFSGGVSLQNIGGGSLAWKNGATEQLGLITKVGGAFAVNNSTKLALDLESGNGDSLIHAGIESSPIKLFSVRAGIDQAVVAAGEKAFNFSGGLGINLDGFSFDYAYRQDASLGDNSSHYFSISLHAFDQERSVSVTEPAKKEIMAAVLEAPVSSIDGVFSIARRPADKDILRYYE